MIQAINITKGFNSNTLFKNLDFTISNGEFVCFSGASGTGKTTLLNIIGLIEPYDEGKLMINGIELINNRQKLEFFRTQVGFIFQNFALVENKTVEQNLKLVRKKNRTNYTILEVLNKVGLAEKINSKVYTLSGGEQQRVALARLFLKKCQIVLADEPTGSLDRENAKKVMDILSNMNKDGKTIILVTHDEEIKKLATRIIYL